MSVPGKSPYVMSIGRMQDFCELRASYGSVIHARVYDRSCAYE